MPNDIGVKALPSKDHTMNHTPASRSSAGGSLRRFAMHVVTGAAAVLAVACGAGLGLPVAPASADRCPNAAVRAQNGSAGLPDCRAYELVTNPFKEGFAPVAPAYGDDGVFGYASTGNFTGNGLGGVFNQYIATRSATGWQTTSPNPSGPEYAAMIASGAEALSADLRSSVWIMRRADESAEAQDLYLRGPDGAFKRIGPGENPASRLPAAPGSTASGRMPLFAGASADLSHVLFTIEGSQAFPGIVGAVVANLYEYVGTGNDHPRYVGVDNVGHQITLCGTRPGAGGGGSHTISTDGRVVFWSPDCGPGVWARVSGTTSIEASASQCTRAPADPGGACNGLSTATYQGAAADGSRAFFTTSQQLVNGDTDATEDLYACDIPPGTPTPTGLVNPCAALSEVSGAATGANVENVINISKDGSRTYFLATGVLAANPGANDAVAVSGDNNLYVWQKDAAHPAGQTTFVGKFDADDIGGAQTTDDGRYLLLFTTTALVGSGAGADTDIATDVYRYDADTRQVIRISTDDAGTGGNGPGLDASTQAAAMTADGQTVVFQTSEGLSPSDVDGAQDIYLWRGGHVSVLGAGAPVGITASGKDIYFMTTAQLTPNDGDTLQDFYDARVGGGFDFSRPAPCQGGECHGEPSAPPGAPAPASNASVGQGDIPRAAQAFSLRPVTAAQGKRLATTGKLTLTMSADGPGIVRATATATIARRAERVASAQRTQHAAGTVTLALVLSKKARAQLAAAGRLTVKVVVSDSEVAATRSATLKLIATKGRAKAKRSAAGDRGDRS
jgi:hypothetical protein